MVSKKGDRFLICTNGIWGAVPEVQLTEIVSELQFIELVMNHLIADIDRIGLEKGGMHDNMQSLVDTLQQPVDPFKLNQMIQTVKTTFVAVTTTRS